GGHVSTVPGMPTILLHTTGRRSGRDRTSPLFYVPAGDGVAVVDTNYGREPRPGWSHNLAADPDAAFTLAGVRRDARARTAGGEERTRLWSDLVDLYPPYEDYAAGLRRSPRVWVLDPV
ncbi:MAG: nitroreductase/quinone reductase family protein, partial [Acidimicrobiia bacterium]|nr:nitroreductase/quinone reductase family protein [Acidimicrobiia bacterium]